MNDTLKSIREREQAAWDVRASRPEVQQARRMLGIDTDLEISTGLRLLARVRWLEEHLAKAEEDLAKLQDPLAVHLNMLRGTVAKPTWEQILHVYGKKPSDAADLHPCTCHSGSGFCWQHTKLNGQKKEDA